jgi:hypothetical protein
LAKLIGPATKEPAGVLDSMEVRTNGGVGEVAAPQLLKLIFYTIVSEVIDYQHVAVLEMA